MSEQATSIPGASTRRVLIVAGGTGGHVAPALAVGATLREQHGERVLVRYVTGRRAIERQAFDAAHEFPDTIACDAPPRLALAATPQLLRYAGAIVESMRLLRRFRPHAVLAMGGYVCAPVLWAARALRVPYFLHESNAAPGRVTRMFARRARAAFVAHDAAGRRLPAGSPVRLVGTPVRRELLGVDPREARALHGIEPGAPVLALVGGSQGAQALNEALAEALPLLARSVPGLRVLWACGPLNLRTAEQALRERGLGDAARVFDYVNDMGRFYAAADLVASRAGASTLAELAALGKPSILVPYPHAKDNHQAENAQALASAGAAEVIDEAALTGASLAEAIAGILGSRPRLDAMAAAARGLSTVDAAAAIASALMDEAQPDPNHAPAGPDLRRQQTA